MSRPIRIGVQLWPGGAPDYRTWRQAVLDAEAMGVDAIFGYDHFHRPNVLRGPERSELLPDQPDVNNFEGWTALASWGELTSRVEIGVMVSGSGYRNPDLLADMARTVDHISGGRLILGVGAGWYQKDYAVYSYDYGTVASRMALFATTVDRIRFRLDRLTPAPLRPIPILIGGAGERKTLPVVGRHADIWHSYLDIDTFRRKNAIVREYALDAGRQDDDIERASGWGGEERANAATDEGVTLFIAEIKPEHGAYDLSVAERMLAWRSGRG